MSEQPEHEGVRFASVEDSLLYARDRDLYGTAFVRLDGDGLAHRIDPRNVTPAGLRDCEFCGKPLDPLATIRRAYCSGICRVYAWRQRSRVRDG